MCKFKSVCPVQDCDRETPIRILCKEDIDKQTQEALSEAEEAVIYSQRKTREAEETLEAGRVVLRNLVYVDFE